MKFKTFALAAMALATASTARAATWDAVSGFGTANTSGSVWSYGWSVNGGAFTQFNTYTNGPDGHACFAGLSCWYETGMVAYSVPTVAANLTSSTITYANTVVHPNNVLNLHPGMTLEGSNLDIDAIVRFTAPTSGSYDYSGFFEALDINPSGVAITVAGVPVTISGAANISALTTGAPTAFSGRTYLAAGDTIDFRVNRAGVIWNDSTGLSATVAAVPEPMSWALMIMGFGGTGAALRSRRRSYGRA